MSDTPNPPQDPTGTPAPGPGNTPPLTPEYQSAGVTQAPEAADVEKNKNTAALSYVFILWLVPMLTAKDSPFAKFHCNQGILLSILGFGLGIVVMVATFIVAWIPILNLCGGCILWLLYLAGMVTLMIIGIMNAVNGKMKTLPLFPKIDWVK